ncbi:MAG: hypothetical protein H7Z74_00100 [Anaerolineae bacterium]|nr:hypothetical protein [Gemmatimonadaceae bacterium]
MSRYLILAGLVLVTAACAPTVSTPGSTVSSAQRGARDFIDADEIRNAAGGNALDLVRNLRPMWLAKRGPQSLHYEGDVVVYLGTARLGGLPALSEIAVSSLTSLRFLDVAAANYRFGGGHPYGAILVSTSDPGVR